MTIHIHEDDWAMRNLYPLDALPEASADVAQAREAGERNRAPDGAGWTDIHVIRPPSKDYSVMNLLVADATAALDGLMPRVRRFIATASVGFDPGAEPVQLFRARPVRPARQDESPFLVEINEVSGQPKGRGSHPPRPAGVGQGLFAPALLP